MKTASFAIGLALLGCVSGEAEPLDNGSGAADVSWPANLTLQRVPVVDPETDWEGTWAGLRPIQIADQMVPPFAVASESSVWPLTGAQHVLTRFATPISYDRYIGFHEGFDIARDNASGPTAVRSPVAGRAVLVTVGADTFLGCEGTYDCAAAIRSNELLILMAHFQPTTALRSAAGGLVVHAGDVLGELAPWPAAGDPRIAESMRHLHTAVFNSQTGRVVDPARIFPYQDHVAPELLGFRFERRVLPYTFELQAEVVDRDDQARLPFEVSRIAYLVRDDRGEVVHWLPDCALDDLVNAPGFAENVKSIAHGAIDGRRTRAALASGASSFPYASHDQSSANNTYTYRLSRLTQSAGRCVIGSDEAWTFSPQQRYIDVYLRLLDARGNRRDTFSRIELPR